MEAGEEEVAGVEAEDSMASHCSEVPDSHSDDEHTCQQCLIQVWF